STSWTMCVSPQGLSLGLFGQPCTNSYVCAPDPRTTLLESIFIALRMVGAPTASATAPAAADLRIERRDGPPSGRRRSAVDMWILLHWIDRRIERSRGKKLYRTLAAEEAYRYREGEEVTIAAAPARPATVDVS